MHFQHWITSVHNILKIKKFCVPTEPVIYSQTHCNLTSQISSIAFQLFLLCFSADDVFHSRPLTHCRKSEFTHTLISVLLNLNQTVVRPFTFSLLSGYYNFKLVDIQKILMQNRPAKQPWENTAEGIHDSNVILISVLLPSTFFLHDTLKLDLF